MSPAPPPADDRVGRRLLAVGMLTHNSAATIESMLVGFARQSLFHRADLDVRLHVVANGCSDDTVAKARVALGRPDVRTSLVNAEVHDVACKGKANAWNLLIHDFVDPDTEFVVMIDDDITFPDDDSCALVVDRLIADDDAVVAIDRAVSDLALVERPGLLGRLVLLGTDTDHDPTTSITGQFYCGRYAALRSIRMPAEIIGEDGYLRASVLTRNFTADEDFRRVTWVPEASHVYASERTVASILHHQVRQTTGTIFNIVLFGHLRSVSAHEPDLATYVERRNAEDREWLPKLVMKDWPGNVGAGARRRLLTRRTVDATSRLRRIPVLGALTIVDLLVYALAMRTIRSGRATGFW